MSLTAVFSLIAFVIGCIVIFYILKRYKQVPARLLGLSLFAPAWLSLLIFMFSSGSMLTFPIFFGTDGLTGYLMAPAFFLYASFILTDKKKFTWWDALHLLPTALYIIDFMPFLLASSADRQQWLRQLTEDPTKIIPFRFGWLSIKEFYVIRFGLSIVYMVAVGALLLRFFKRHFIEIQASFATVVWIGLIAGLYFFLSVFEIFVVLFFIAIPQSLLPVFIIMAVFLATGIALIARPHVFYSSYNEDADSLKVSRRSQLSDEMTGQLAALLQGFISDKHFLNKNSSLTEVAEELGIRPYILSAFINQAYNMRFYDFINHYRIEYIKQELLGKTQDKLTLEIIAEKAGYNNRTTFLAAFKRNTGMTPTDFIKQSEKNERPNRSR